MRDHQAPQRLEPAGVVEQRRLGPGLLGERAVRVHQHDVAAGPRAPGEGERHVAGRGRVEGPGEQRDRTIARGARAERLERGRPSASGPRVSPPPRASASATADGNTGGTGPLGRPVASSPRPYDGAMDTQPTMPPPPSSVERCYRHPDVQTGVHCTRCGRPICPDCMRSAPVGHHCPTCVEEARKEFRQGPGRRIAVANAKATSVTAVLLVAIGAVYVLEVVEAARGRSWPGRTGSCW